MVIFPNTQTPNDPHDLRQTINEAAKTLKGKLMAQLPDLSIPTYVKDRYSFAPYIPNFPPKISIISTKLSLIALILIH